MGSANDNQSRESDQLRSVRDIPADFKPKEGESVVDLLNRMSLNRPNSSKEEDKKATQPLKKSTPRPMPNPLASNYSYGHQANIFDKPPVAAQGKETYSRKVVDKAFKRSQTSNLAQTLDFIQGKGKYADSATTEADVGDEELPIEMQPAKVGSPVRSGMHRRPKFKQILKTSGEEESSLRKQAELSKLIDSAAARVHEPEDSSELVVEGLVPRLLPHQSRGVRFMAGRERIRTGVRGGLLADQMGLGKTIQSIALILYCPPDRANASQRAPRTTLVVVPLAVMDQWRDEIRHMAPSLRVGRHHGPDRTTSDRDLVQYDVLVTTYDIVTREHQAAGPLFDVEWYRVIADEAHVFRNSKTKIASAMAALKSDGRRWALTGTPLHNGMSDLFPLFCFLGVPAKSLPDESTSSQADVAAFVKRKLGTFMLRRTQRVLTALPALVQHRTAITFTTEERKVYASLSVDPKMLKNPFTLLVRMRQSCNGILNEDKTVEPGWSDVPHGAHSAEKGKRAADAGTETPEAEAEEKWSESLEKGTVDESDELASLLGMLSIKPKTQDNHEDKGTFMGHNNSKIQEVRRILVKNRTRRTIVFSSFLTMLHALRPMLEYEGLKYQVYDGSLKADERQRVLTKFRDENSGEVVLLCSLLTAAVGLNLTSASQVIVVEPWWNPQIIDQAIKRVHRLGQTETVDCYELYAEKALDERMMVLQDKKRQLAKEFIDVGHKLSKEDRMFLLSDDAALDERPAAADATTDDEPQAKPASGKTATGLPWAEPRTLPSVPRHSKKTVD